VVASRGPVEDVSASALGSSTVDGELYVVYTYNRQGESWGYVDQYLIPYGRIRGWVAMADLLLPYDHHVFAAEHTHEFKPHQDDLDALYREEQVVTWNWPGGPRFSIISISAVRPGDYIWLDSANLAWVFNAPGSTSLGSNKWICVSDPTNQDLYSGMVYYPPPAAWHDPNPPARLISQTLLSMIGAVLALVLITYSLIRKFYPQTLHK